MYAASPAMCAVGCRKALELAVKWVYAADNTMQMPYEISGLGQAAQGCVTFQLDLFFFDQSDFQPEFFIVRTQNDSSILSDFHYRRGYSGFSPGNGFCPLRGEIRCSLSLWIGLVSKPVGKDIGRTRLLFAELW